MSYERTIPGEQPTDTTEPACVYLRSKAIYVTGDLNPDHPDEKTSHDENCWCNITQHVIGPDDTEVSRVGCTNGRACFRATR